MLKKVCFAGGIQIWASDMSGPHLVAKTYFVGYSNFRQWIKILISNAETNLHVTVCPA